VGIPFFSCGLWFVDCRSPPVCIFDWRLENQEDWEEELGGNEDKEDAEIIGLVYT